MEDQILDSSLSQQETPNPDTLIYSTFWNRLAATILDGLIVGVVGACLVLIGFFNTDLYYITTPIQLAFTLFYYIYLVQAKGATPGKMAMNLKIIKTDGTDVDFKSALMRYLPSLIISVINQVITLASVSSIDPEIYQDLSWMQKLQHLSTINPTASSMMQYVAFGWFVVDTIVFFSNTERRAMHDKIADTVVITTK